MGLALFSSDVLAEADEEVTGERMPHSGQSELSSLRSGKRSGIEPRAREIEGRLGL